MLCWLIAGHRTGAIAAAADGWLADLLSGSEGWGTTPDAHLRHIDWVSNHRSLMASHALSTVEGVFEVSQIGLVGWLIPLYIWQVVEDLQSSLLLDVLRETLEFVLEV